MLPTEFAGQSQQDHVINESEDTVALNPFEPSPDIFATPPTFPMPKGSQVSDDYECTCDLCMPIGAGHEW